MYADAVKFIFFLLSSVLIASPAPKQTTPGGKLTLGGKLTIGTTAPPIPTLDLYLGKTGLDVARGGGAAANSNIFAMHAAGSPLAPSAGSLVVMSGEWPDAEATTNGYANNCTSHCAPTFTDNNSNTLTPVFTVGSCIDTGTNANNENLDHGFYYEANLQSGTTSVTEVHPAQVANSGWDIANFYNVATTSVVDASSCTPSITPTTNTAFNIVGTSMTISGTNDLILVAVDDTAFVQQNPWNSSPLTIPSGCTLLNANASQAVLGAARVLMQCTASPGTFTPKISIAQTTHDTFTIYAVAFKAGSGGSPPTTSSADFHVAVQAMTSGAGTWAFNIACPTGTNSLVITDDAASVSAVADSNSDTFISASGTGVKTYYKLGISISNPNTFTTTLTTTAGNVDQITWHCLSVGNLDTGFTAGTYTGGTPNVTSTQITPSSGSSASVQASITEATGSGNCEGTALALVTCTGIPTGTPGESSDLFIGVCDDGTGPMLQPTQPSGTVAEYVGPAALTNITNGDSDDYLNGDFGFFLWSTAAPVAISWGFTAQQQSASVTCMVTAFHK